MTEENQAIQQESVENVQETVTPAEPTADTDTGSLLGTVAPDEGIAFDFSTGDKPEGFPDEFWDAESKNPKIQDLFDGLKKNEKIAQDLRAKMGKGDHKAPKEATDYKFEASEKAAELIPADDPLVGAAQEIAHKHGMSQEMFSSFMAEMTDRMVDLQGEAAPAVEPTEAEIAEVRQAEYAKIGENAPAVIRAVESWIHEQKSMGLFSEQDVEIVKSMSTTGDQIRVLNKLRTLTGGNNIPMDSVGDGLQSDMEIAEIIDKAYSSGDQESVRKAEELLDRRRQAGRPERLQF